MIERLNTYNEFRRDDLLADLALVGLTAAERAELEQLGYDQDLLQSLETAAAAIELAIGPVEFPPLPATLRTQIERQASAYFTTIPRSRSRSRRPWLIGLGVMASAASVGLAIWLGVRSLDRGIDGAIDLQRIAWQVPQPPPPVEPLRVWDAQARRERVIALPNAAKLAGEVAPVSGEVVWSDTRQQGYLRFKGLPANNPTRSQYQLWIFDPKRDARYPVDGGVFDVVINLQGEATIPIHPRLRVLDPSAFVVTEEVPGGVVVSDRSKVVATAVVAAR